MNKSKKLLLAATLAFSATLLSGCVSESSGQVYKRSEVKQAQIVQRGTIKSIRPVKIQGKESNFGIGTIGGAALGGIAGGSIGHGLGSAAAAVGGALLGGMAGNAVEGKVREENGIEIIVRLDNGTEVSVVQAADQAFSVGQHVKVVGSGENVRVSP